MFPLQQRNFYNYVMENKEVMKTLSLLTSCTQEMRDVSEFFALEGVSIVGGNPFHLSLY